MTRTGSWLLCAALAVVTVSGCAKPGLVTSEKAEPETHDAGIRYMDFDAAAPNLDSDELFSGTIDRGNSGSAWNGLFVPQPGAHVLFSVLRDNGEVVERLRVSQDPNLIYQSEVPLEYIPFTYEVNGNKDIWLAKGDSFLFFCTVFNHAGNQFLAGDLLNESPARFRGLRNDINVQVTGLEACNERRGGLCALNAPDGGIPTISIEANIEDSGVVPVSVVVDSGALPIGVVVDAGK